MDATLAATIRKAFDMLGADAVTQDAVRAFVAEDPPSPEVAAALASAIRRVVPEARLAATGLDALRAWAHELSRTSALTRRGTVQLKPAVSGSASVLSGGGNIHSNPIRVDVALHEGRASRLDLPTFIAILSLLIAILTYAHDKQSDGESISQQDAQHIVEEAMKAVRAERSAEGR